MLRKALLQICCLVAIFQSAHAQSDTLRWHPGVKLKYSDFTIERTAAFDAAITLHSGYRAVPVNAWKFVPAFDVKVVFDRSLSTMPDSSVLNLRYAQLQFDLMAYQGRLLQWKVFQLGDQFTAASMEKAVEDASYQANREVAQLGKEMSTQLSTGNEQILSAWEGKVSDLLRSTPEVELQTQPYGMQLGLFMGVSQSFFTGKTATRFTNPTGFDLGFNVDYKRSRLVLDISLGLDKTKMELEEKGVWPVGLKTTFTSVELTYGYKFAKDKWLAVPYAGLGINGFSPRPQKNGDRRNLDGYSPVVGFELNRYFKNMGDSGEDANFFYRLRASINPSNFVKHYAGTQFNVKLAAGFDVIRLRRKFVKKSSL